ncbi:MAG: C39 family peptidase [Luteolibacter sp.]
MSHRIGRVRSAVVTLLVGLSIVEISSAIPNTVGGGLFNQAAGAPPEAFFQKAAAWQVGAKIPGTWTDVSENFAVWNTPETAFGLMADRISLRRDDDDKLTEVILTYSAATTSKSAAGLHDALRTILGVIDAEPEENEDGSIVFESGSLQIMLPGKADKTLELSLTCINSTDEMDLNSSLPGWLFPGDLSDPEIWDSQNFLAAWKLQKNGAFVPGRVNHPDPPAISGLPVQLAEAVISADGLRALSLVILDAGAHFGYAQTSSGLTREALAEFDRIFSDSLDSTTNTIANLTGDSGKSVTLGSRTGVELPAMLFSGNGIHARLISLPHQSVILEFFRSAEDAESLSLGTTKATKNTEQDPLFSDDIGTRTMPMVPQGNRAYCGPAALAMISNYIGLNISTEVIAGLAGFAYGTSQNGDIRKLSSQIAKEAGLRASRSSKFDPKKAAESFSNGLPVLVFRRWSAERDFIHQTMATKLANGDLTAILPEPGFADAESWPDKSAPAHASVVHGYNPVRKEVIFTESWGNRSAGKRMRIEELEETAYYAVYFRR